MNENFTKISQTIYSLIELNLLPVIKVKIKEQRVFIEKCRIEFSQLSQLLHSEEQLSQSDLINKTIYFNEKIKNLISIHFQRQDVENLRNLFPDLLVSLEKFILEAPEVIKEFQDVERFQKDTKDTLHIKFIKPYKQILFISSNTPVVFTNIFRKIFKKPLKEKKRWKRNVPLKKLRQFYFHYLLNTKLLELKRKYYFQRSAAAKGLWDIYESLDEKLNKKIFPDLNGNKNDSELINISSRMKELQSNLSLFEESLIVEVDTIVTSIVAEYKDKYFKAGTIEFPKRKLRNGVLRRKEKQLHQTFYSIHNGWENNFTALGDDWQMNNEIYLVRYNASKQLEIIRSNFKTNINNNLVPIAEKITYFVKEMRELLNTSSSQNELIKNYDLLKSKIKEHLTDILIPEFNYTLLNQNLSGLVAEFDDVLLGQINNFKTKRLLVKTEDYDTEIKNSEINIFSPKEILEYDAAPKFFNTTNKLKSSINAQMQQVQNKLSEIDHIADFTIDSAINKLEQETDETQSKVIAIEGLDRVLNILTDARQNFNNTISHFDSELNTATNEFNLDLKNLTQTEKIFGIRINLAKAKALQKSKQLRKQSLENIRNIIPHIFVFVKNTFIDTKILYHKTRELFGYVQSARVISTEVSDYLAETQSAILRLPFVYQRLFEVKPLEDERFFFGRESELKELNKARANWETEKFAPTVIVGEKGSGTTSLINHYISINTSPLEIIRTSVNHPFSEPEDFLKLFSDLLKTDRFRSSDELVSYLNNLPDKKIIIVENLQRLFLRKVDGFRAIKMFFEIVSKTNKKIFWISTCTLYSWTYLDKTVHAPDYFGYVINLRKLNEDQMTDLVSKRHRVSGYNIHYEADEHTQKSKSFRKFSEEEKQTYLRNRYFVELNKFAQSNISLALLFWLRSAKEIVNDIIKIGSPPDLDYSFIENFSNDKVFALTALLIHDGLTSEDHAKLFNSPLNISNLLFLLMRDDGIVIEHNQLYLINPLLYRQIVGFLKSRNIIH